MKTEEFFWRRTVEESRKVYLKDIFESTSSCSSFGFIPATGMNDIMASIEGKLSLAKDSEVHQDMAQMTLNIAEDMFGYLFSCPPKVEMDAKVEDLEQSINIYTPKEILIILNRMLYAKGLPYRLGFRKIFEQVRKAWIGSAFEDITKLTGKYHCNGEGCQVSPSLLQNQDLCTIVNHPVHIFDRDQTLSPSSFIPFCWFGDKLGMSTDNFSVSVCENFKPKLRNDQICYEIDANEYLQRGLEKSESITRNILYFIVDENIDRISQRDTTLLDLARAGKLSNFRETFMLDLEDDRESFIVLDTIGKPQFHRRHVNELLYS